MLQGLMQDRPLLISNLIEFAERHNGDAEIVSRRVEGDIHRYTWAACARRARQVANALDDEQLQVSDRVATLAWNGYRHLELYYGVSGSGRVLHTINPRLHPDQIAWIVNHAEDQVLCFDLSFLPVVQAVHAKCTTVRKWVALCDIDRLPANSGVPGLASYEAWIGGQANTYDWPVFDENAASSLCYTSGTTGNPKGALYSHRSTVLHAYGSVLPDMMALSARDSVLPVVPMFHVNAWGIPYSAALVGCKLVFPGPALDGKSVYELIEAEKVSFAAGVPTVWQMLLAHTQAGDLGFSTLRRTVIGGAACPPAMLREFEQQHDVRVLHGWGMTEMSPLGTVCSLKKAHDCLPREAQLRVLEKQGRAVYGVDMKIVDAQGRALPWDGRAAGDLLVRGPWIVRAYFKGEGGNPLVDGWFPTGDVATIDAEGYLQITDRSKDVIKSGGEWISSIDIENIAMAHPAVALAACIGIPHPKWDERPIVVVARKPGARLEREELLAFYEGKTARWQVPDDVVFVDAIPLGATGKILKTRLREDLRGHILPGPDGAPMTDTRPAGGATPARPTDPAAPTGLLCDWLAGFTLDDAPESARERARMLTLDGIACAIVGAQLPWSRTAVDIVRRFEGAGTHTIVGWGAGTNAPAAALLNGTFIQGFELDDYHPLGPLHSASIVLPALWAAVESSTAPVTGRRFLEAAMVGYEVGPRVGMALHGAQMLSRGWHSGSVFGTHAAAAAVGKLLGLDAARFEDALGLAGTQSAGLMAAQYEAMCKRMHHGFSARNGLYAAVLAEGGYTGIKRVFEREYGGFLSTFGEGHDPDASQITDGLGTRWEVERIVIKPYAAMGGIHSPLDALFDIGRQRPLRASEIARIECDVSHAVYHHGWWTPQRPLTPIGAQMNIGYALAVAVLDGAAMVAQFAPNRIDADDVWALLPRIEVRHDPAFDTGGMMRRGRTRVAVTFHDGERLEVERNASRAIESPQTSAEIASKYRTLTDALIDAPRQQAIESLVRGLDAVGDMRELLARLAPPARAAFD